MGLRAKGIVALWANSTSMGESSLLSVGLLKKKKLLKEKLEV